MLEDDGGVEAETVDVVASGGFSEMCVPILIPLQLAFCGIARGGVEDGIDIYHFW